MPVGEIAIHWIKEYIESERFSLRNHTPTAQSFSMFGKSNNPYGDLEDNP